MLNTPMNQPPNNSVNNNVANLPKPERPNEHAGFAVSGFVRIFDPGTKETLLETRA